MATATPVDASVAADALKAVGVAAGLSRVGIASAEAMTRTRHDLEQRGAAGLAADMQFTYRNPARSTEPDRIVSGARSLVVGARSYPADPARGEGRLPLGTVARYARDDHYAALRDGLEAIAIRLRGEGHVARVVADDNALVDREAAVRAGLGWYGKNSNVLLAGAGSWFVLGSVVTDAELAVDAPAEGSCGPCRRCLDGCPTGAIVAPGVVDARRCLAWLVQAPGPIPVAFREALGDRIYGCDDCQEVCPPNRDPAPMPESQAAGDASIDLCALLQSSDDELLARHGRWYIAERDPRYLRRNALVALGNVSDPGDPDVTGVLDRYAHDGDEMLAEHARWARQAREQRR